MSRRLGACGLGRNAVVRFRTNLRDDLEKDYDLLRSSRHPMKPQYFVYKLAVAEGAVTHRFTFLIDDSTAPDHLFIIDFKYRRSPP
jgi:hypothetical protein